MAIRVVQWTTGNIGKSSVKAISANEAEVELNGSTGEVTVVAEDTRVPNVGNDGRLNVFPVPANDHLILQWEDMDVQEVHVLDATGRSVFSDQTEGTTNLKINTAQFLNGTYLLQVKTGERSVIRRFVILH